MQHICKAHKANTQKPTLQKSCNCQHTANSPLIWADTAPQKKEEMKKPPKAAFSFLLSNSIPSIQNNLSIFAILKKVISIFFLAIYLLSTTQLSELLKLPMLVQHYMEHRHENKDLSFIGFLEIHYAHGSPRDADYDKDMKLPFKSMNNCGISSISFCTPLPNFKHNPIVYCTNNKQQFSDYSFTYASAFLSSIWQPPKSC